MDAAANSSSSLLHFWTYFEDSWTFAVYILLLPCALQVDDGNDNEKS